MTLKGFVKKRIIENKESVRFEFEKVKAHQCSSIMIERPDDLSNLETFHAFRESMSLPEIREAFSF